MVVSGAEGEGLRIARSCESATRRFIDSAYRNSVSQHRSFARHPRPQQVPAGRNCKGCRVRGNLKLSGVRDTLKVMRIGRVSTRDRHPEAQHDALTAVGCEQIFVDKSSGTLASRPELTKAVEDTARARCRSGGLDQVIDTSTAVGRMFFHILGAIAEFEHALMSERTRDGLADARARGRAGGQKPKLGPPPGTAGPADERRNRRTRQTSLHGRPDRR